MVAQICREDMWQARDMMTIIESSCSPVGISLLQGKDEMILVQLTRTRKYATFEISSLVNPLQKLMIFI